MVGQSVMCATVTWSCVGSPPCSWESLLGEGSISLKDLSPLLGHWSCNNQCGDCQSSLSCPSLDVILFSSCWIENLICAIHASKTYKMVVNVTYFNLWICSLKSFDIVKSCNVIGVVCHSDIYGCSHVLCELNEIVMSYSCGGCLSQHSDLVWSLYEAWWFELWHLLWLGCDLDWLHLCLSPWWCLEFNLAWWLLKVCGELLEFLKEVSFLGSPWWCDHIHCICST